MVDATWQDYAVWAVGLAVAWLLVGRLACALRGKRRDGCTSCAAGGCPLRGMKKKDASVRKR